MNRGLQEEVLNWYWSMGKGKEKSGLFSSGLLIKWKVSKCIVVSNLKFLREVNVSYLIPSFRYCFIVFLFNCSKLELLAPNEVIFDIQDIRLGLVWPQILLLHKATKTIFETVLYQSEGVQMVLLCLAVNRRCWIKTLYGLLSKSQEYSGLFF